MSDSNKTIMSQTINIVTAYVNDSCLFSKSKNSTPFFNKRQDKLIHRDSQKKSSNLVPMP